MTLIHKIPVIGVILPCYNEEEVLRDSFTKLNALVKNLIATNKIDRSSFIAFIDDGSKDKTWQLIEELKNVNSLVKGLKLANNSGHQSAILAGMFTFKDDCDCIITIDADLQDDINAMEKMIEDFTNGIDVVYGIRKGRPSDSFFKKNTALAFYKFMKMLGVNIKYNHADYRLVSKRVIEELSRYKEVNIFLRGIFPIIGFKHSEVHYDRKERLAGETKYPFRKMLSFAFDGITSFSIRPLRIITVMGTLTFIASLLLCLYAVYSFIYLDVVPGWASIVIPIYFIGGVQLLSIGIIGEYLGKIYKEVKQRPLYSIDKKI